MFPVRDMTNPATSRGELHVRKGRLGGVGAWGQVTAEPGRQPLGKLQTMGKTGNNRYRSGKAQQCDGPTLNRIYEREAKPWLMGYPHVSTGF
jgi:hypothetical protein